MLRPSQWVEKRGTRWPVPESWSEIEPDVFSGEDGLLKLVAQDGMLIDFSRSRSAGESAAGEWGLAWILNGVALFGRVSEGDTEVLVYSVRAERDSSEETLPELQAVYVVPKLHSRLLDMTAEALSHRRVRDEECGALDGAGHLAMGPVPCHGSWRPLGEQLDSVGSARMAGLGEAGLVLVGGGWLTLCDEGRNSGFLLQPMSWRQFDVNRVLDFIRDAARRRGFDSKVLSLSEARVFRSHLASSGVSYEGRDSEGRTRTVGAFWSDPLGQMWLLHYWFDVSRGGAIIQALGALSGSVHG